ncbi:MAG: hypothetical protein ACRC18_06630 [Cetobacterium sp.]
MKLNSGLSLDLYQDEEKNKELLHDISLKLIPTKINLNIWEIKYSYKTKRGNQKENHKYAIATDSTDAKVDFLNYIDKFNNENQHRSLSNVKILDVKYVGQLEQSY